MADEKPIRIKDLEPGTAVTTMNPVRRMHLEDYYKSPGGAKEAVRPITQFDYLQDRPDTDESGSYSKGGVIAASCKGPCAGVPHYPNKGYKRHA